jgi:hypothetical protein
MPFKSNKQKKYFFAKLNSLPKGSEQYNKWKKVVDKFVAHSVDESYELDEARRNPEVNVDQPIAKQIEQFVEKHKGQEDLIFVSFRDDVHVTFINPKNEFNTPTGIYVYPWKNYYDKTFEKYIKNFLVADPGKNIPFGGERKYMFMYKLKSNKGILTNQTTYNDTLPYANKLFNLIKNNEIALEIVNYYIYEYEDYLNYYYNDNSYANSYFDDVHKFWILLYLVADKLTKGKTQDTIGNLCRAIGVNGFVDFDGKGYIHPSELKQAVFFRGRELFDDIKIINTQSSQNKIYNRNLFDYINNKEFMEKLNSDIVYNLLNNAPNERFINIIIDKLLSNKKFVSDMDGASFTEIIKHATSDENIDYIVRTVLSDKNFLNIDSENKIYFLLKYAKRNEMRMFIIDVLLSNENFSNKIDEGGIKYMIIFIDYKNKDDIIEKIINNKKIISNIIGSKNSDVVSYLILHASDKYKTILINTLLKIDDILGNKKNALALLNYSDPEKREEIIDEILQNKTFISSLSVDLIYYEKPMILDFLLSVYLSTSIKQKIADKIIELKPDILQKLLNNMGVGLILNYTSFDKDSLINNINLDLIETEYAIHTLLNNVSHPKSFAEKISLAKGDEIMKNFFNSRIEDEFYIREMIKNSKNKKEIVELFKKYTDKDYSDKIETPMNEIFKSLTSLQEELNIQNKVNVKQRNLEKVKRFLLERKGFLDEDFKSQEQNYIKQGNEPQIVKSYIERFKTIKDRNYKQINDQIGGLENVKDRKNIESYENFKELEIFVDYVGGQIDLAGTSLGNDIEIDAKPIYEDNIFEIYYADSPRACIKYKGNIPYGWCVSKREGNMFYTYRYKENEPAFYFVKVKDRTKKELGFFSMVGNVFNGNFKDKYHFFVLQSLKGAKMGDKTTKQYVVTSAMNDGDTQMSWNDVVKIEPRIGNLQEIFKPVGLSPEDKKFYNKFKNGTDDNTFCKLDYTNKRRYLDVYVAQDQLLTDVQFKCLPEDLMNLYVGFGVGLLENQLELIKSNKNLLKRYIQIIEKKYEEHLKGTRGIKFNYNELLILSEDKRQEIIKKLSYDNIYHLFKYSPKENHDKIINMLFNIGGKEFIINLKSNDINILLNKSSDPEEVTDMLFNIGGKEFIMNLNSNDIYRLLNNSPNSDKIIDILFNIGGKEFIMNLDSLSISNLLKLSSDPEKIMRLLGDKGKEFIMNSNPNIIIDLLGYSADPEKIIDILFNIGGKELIMKLDSKTINRLLSYSSDPEKIIVMFDKITNGRGKEFVIKSNFGDTDDMINSLLYHSKVPNKIMALLGDKGKEYIMKLRTQNIKFMKEPEKIINILLAIGGKEYIMNLDKYDIGALLEIAKELQIQNNLINSLLDIGGKEFIIDMDSDSLASLLNYSSEKDKIIDKLFNIGGKDFVKSLYPYDVKTLLASSREPEKIKQILQQYGKLPKESMNENLIKTPMNEIFKSLTSLQEELTEQRKETIKETNLMKVQNFIKNRKNNQ